jgi:hypothetical protein
MPLVRGSTVWPDEVGRVRAVALESLLPAFNSELHGTTYPSNIVSLRARLRSGSISGNPRVESPLENH